MNCNDGNANDQSFSCTSNDVIPNVSDSVIITDDMMVDLGSVPSFDIVTYNFNETQHGIVEPIVPTVNNNTSTGIESK
jgi:hypothetical protein